MGNYLFHPKVLLEALDATHAAGGVDFGRDLLPRLVRPKIPVWRRVARPQYQHAPWRDATFISLGASEIRLLKPAISGRPLAMAS